MTYPAWFELHKDPAIVAQPTALRVYASLVGRAGIFFEPQDVKAWLVAEVLGASRNSVNRSLDLLIRQGYVIEYARGQNNVRQLLLVHTRHLHSKRAA